LPRHPENPYFRVLTEIASSSRDHTVLQLRYVRWTFTAAPPKQKPAIQTMKLSPVLRIIDSLEEDLELDDEWKQLSEEHTSKFESFVLEEDEFSLEDSNDDTFDLHNFGKKKLWNIADAKTRASMIADPTQISSFLERIVEKLKRCCLLIKLNFELHVSEATKQGEDPRSLDLLCFYGQFNVASIPRASRQSEGAVSDRNDCRSSVVGAALKADQIHHNMFQDDTELSFQQFKFFEIGGQRDPDRTLQNLIDALRLEELKDSLMEFLPGALANLNHARSFLSGCTSPPETLTQAVFVAFLVDLVEKMNNAFPSLEDGNVVVIAGMDTVDLPVLISEKYMRGNGEKRGVPYSGGPKNTTLKMKSDVAIIKGRSDRYSGDPPGAQQQKMFLNCLVNVEMKKWQLLANSKNKAPLTQVAAESMVRSVKLEGGSRPGSLFSLLTDCGVLYCVWHKVDVREYWISRSVDGPKEVLLSVCWLYLCARGIIKGDFSAWEYHDDNEEVAVEEAGGDAGRSNLESVDETDEADDDGKDAQASGDTASNRASHIYGNTNILPVVSFEDEEEEEKRKMWQTLFVMENHRKYGTPLPLSDEILSLHNARETTH
jgi:hypothetical protein